MVQPTSKPNEGGRLKVRVLGCSGAIAKDCRTTSFLIDGTILVDAGTGVGDLTLAEMQSIDCVLLTHAHLDHIAALPLMVDAIGSARSQPVMVFALAGTIEALQTHIFNNVIWPDFTRIPSSEAPFIRFAAIHVGQQLQWAGKTIEVLPAVHTVPAAGFAISAGQGQWVFTGDTASNPHLWERINQMQVAMLVIETAFSSREAELAQRSLHLSPATLAQELDKIDYTQPFPIYITHTKPAETDLIMNEIQSFDETLPLGMHVSHDIRWLSAGQEFEI
jgi:cAMP phosphodiesterase